MSGDTAPGGKTPSRPSSILFMCGMNAIRSPMAEALARAMLPQTVYVASAGVRAGDMVHLLDMYPSPGMTDSVCTVFMATGCEPVDHDRHGPEEESMEILHVPLDDALAMIDAGEIADAKTVCGLYAAERRLRSRG